MSFSAKSSGAISYFSMLTSRHLNGDSAANAAAEVIPNRKKAKIVRFMGLLVQNN